MKNLRIISMLLLALVPTVLPEASQRRAASSRAHNLTASRITGTVLDKNEARIAGATIKIESERFSRAVLSGDQGEFEVRLPAGVYRLSVEMDGFKRFVLSPFRVKAGGREAVSIHMEVKQPAGTLRID